MSINRNNFEAYMLDYLEGNLDPLLTAELMAFLAENPEFEKMMPDFEIKALLAENNAFEFKQNLKRDFSDIPAINPANFEEFCIASCEGILTNPDLERLDGYIGNDPEKQKVLDTYKLLKLTPDKNVVFPNKSALKKNTGRSIRMRYLTYGLSIAASVAFILLLFINRNQDQPANFSESQQSKTEVPEKIPDTPGVTENLTHAPLTAEYKEAPISDPLPTTEYYRDNFAIAALKPKKAELTSLIPKQSDVLSERTTSINTGLPESQGILADLFTADSFIGSLVSHIDFWKTAEKAISGLNYLTESQLSLSRTVDENGNLTSLVVTTESYTIEGSSK